MSQRPSPGDLVRLVQAAAGLPIGSEGKLVGWYADEPREALVDFPDNGPLRVPADAIAELRQAKPRAADVGLEPS